MRPPQAVSRIMLAITAAGCGAVCDVSVETASSRLSIVRIEFADYDWETGQTDVAAVTNCDDLSALARSFERHHFFELNPRQAPEHETNDGCMPEIVAFLSNGESHSIRDHMVGDPDFFAIVADARALGYDLEGCWQWTGWRRPPN